MPLKCLLFPPETHLEDSTVQKPPTSSASFPNLLLCFQGSCRTDTMADERCLRVCICMWHSSVFALWVEEDLQNRHANILPVCHLKRKEKWAIRRSLGRQWKNRQRLLRHHGNVAFHDTCWCASGAGWPGSFHGWSPAEPWPATWGPIWTEAWPADCSPAPPGATPGLKGRGRPEIQMYERMRREKKGATKLFFIFYMKPNVLTRPLMIICGTFLPPANNATNKTFPKLKKRYKRGWFKIRHGGKQLDKSMAEMESWKQSSASDSLGSFTPEPTVLLLSGSVSHLGRLISLPVVLSNTQNTISSPAGVRGGGLKHWLRKKKKRVIN